jgi:anaerobic dimethyl sulfoxide reductase subunit B (iron-sulfur subunit)
MEQYGFYVNTEICTGCKACMTACFDRNNLEVPQKFRKVYEFGDGTWEQGADGGYATTAFTYYASITCCHCDAPACVAKCPTGAMQKNAETGIVSNDKEVCIGCMTCEQSCPYNHPVKMADNLSHKCVLCSDENAEGAPDPICAVACPVRALEFGTIASLRSKYGDNAKIGDLEDTTAPNVVIGLHRDASKGGKRLNPLEISH